MMLKFHFFHKKQLRNVPYKTFFENIKELRNHVSDRAILRAIHFYNENNLVKKGFSYLKHNNIKGFLKCINDSGNSSYMLLQNTCVPGNLTQNLNLALTLSKNIIKDGAVRVHGGGFEGTILAFVNKNEVVTIDKIMSGLKVTDNYDGDVKNKVVVVSDYYSHAPNRVGEWKILLSVSDKAGNETTQEITITVKDNNGPAFFIDKQVINIDLKNNNLEVSDLVNMLSRINGNFEEINYNIVYYKDFKMIIL